MAMNEEQCLSVREKLVDYADGELAADQAAGVAEHLAACDACQERLEALRRSLVLAREAWAEAAAAVRPAPVPGAARPGRLWKRVAAAAACAAIAAGAAAVWLSMRRGAPEPAEPPLVAYTPESIDRRLGREEISAKLAALAAILARQPGGQQSADETLRHLARAYPETAAGRRAAGSPN